MTRIFQSALSLCPGYKKKQKTDQTNHNEIKKTAIGLFSDLLSLPGFSLLRTFHHGTRWIRQSTTFTSKTSFLLSSASSSVWAISAAAPLLDRGTFLCAFLGMSRLFGLSVLVYAQQHSFLCSGQLQTFPVYSFLWNLQPFL